MARNVLASTVPILSIIFSPYHSASIESSTDGHTLVICEKDNRHFARRPRTCGRANNESAQTQRNEGKKPKKSFSPVRSLARSAKFPRFHAPLSSCSALGARRSLPLRPRRSGHLAARSAFSLGGYPLPLTAHRRMARARNRVGYNFSRKEGSGEAKGRRHVRNLLLLLGKEGSRLVCKASKPRRERERHIGRKS